MSLRHALAAALFLLPAAAAAAPARGVELIDPVAFEVTPSPDAPGVRKAVKLSLLKRGWRVTAEDERHFEATLDDEDFEASIAVEVSARGATIRYVGSDGLGYEVRKGKAYIHANYNRWVQGLTRDVVQQFRMLDAAR